MDEYKGLKLKSILCHVGQTVDGKVRNQISIGSKPDEIHKAVVTSKGVLLFGRLHATLILDSNIQSYVFEYEEVEASGKAKKAP